MASRRGRMDNAKETIGKSKGRTTYKLKKWEDKGTKVKLLLQNLPRLPFEEQFEVLSRFYGY